MKPRDIIRRLEHGLELQPGTDERSAGYGVMGLPFRGGHYLALRRFPATSLGGPYTAIWLRDPDDRWTMLSDVAPDRSCPRYFGRAVERTDVRHIDLCWTGPSSLRVEVTGFLDWELELGATPITSSLSAVGSAMPRALWRNPLVLSTIGGTAGPLLGAGHLRLQGSVPNGQWFQANPRRAWVVTSSRATVEGVDLGPPGPLERQARLGDMWLPQRGLFFVGEAYFEAFDATRHWDPHSAGVVGSTDR
jgi:hypothetical protein